MAKTNRKSQGLPQRWSACILNPRTDHLEEIARCHHLKNQQKRSLAIRQAQQRPNQSPLLVRVRSLSQPTKKGAKKKQTRQRQQRVNVRSLQNSQPQKKANPLLLASKRVCENPPHSSSSIRRGPDADG